MQIIKDVRSFYTDAWSMLLIYVTLFVAFAGIILPLLLKRDFHREIERLKSDVLRDTKQQQESLSQQIKSDTTVAMEQLRKTMQESLVSAEAAHNTTLSAAQEALRKYVKVESRFASAGVFFLQARFNEEQKNYLQAAKDFANSAKAALTAESERNAQVAVHNLCEMLEKVTRTGAERLKTESVDPLVKALQAVNEHERYEILISKLTREMDAAMKREPEKANIATPPALK